MPAPWRLRRRAAPGGDRLPPDRIQGEGDQQRVLRAFRVPPRSGHSEFVDSLALTAAEAEAWPEGSEPPAWAKERIEERWWAWVNATTTRAPASEGVRRIRKIGRRWWSSSAKASSRSQVPGTRVNRHKRQAVKLPNERHHEVDFPGGQFKDVKLSAGHLRKACSCGTILMGARADVERRWAEHVGGPVSVTPWRCRPLERIASWMRAGRSRARDTVDVVDRAVQIASETRPADLIDIARLLADVRHPLPHGPPTPYVFRDPSLVPVAAAASALDATMVTITANTGAQTWNTNAAWVGGVQPTAANDVVIPASSTVTIASATTALCRSCTVQTSGTLAFAATTSNLNIGDGTAGAGNVAFSNAGTLTLTAIGTISFVSTSSTQQTILSGGPVPNVTFNGAGGKWLQSDALAATGATITLTNGTWATAGLSVSASSVTTGAGTKTWTPGASTITVSGSVTALGMGTTNITFTANTAVVVFSNAGVAGSTICTCFSGSMNGMSLVFSALGAGNINLNGGTTGNLVIVGATNKTAAATLVANGTVTGTVAFQGNSATNRLLVQSNTLGTARTITCNGSTTASVTLAGTAYQTQNCDLMDITGAGTASWDLSAVSGNSGDGQGNTGITFTPPATQTNTGVTGNWSDATKWTSRVPLPQDNVVVNTGSGTITADMPRLGKDINFTGFTGTWGVGSAPNTSYGSIALASGMAFSGGQFYTLNGRSTHTITSAGASWAMTVNVSGPGGTYTLHDAFAQAATGNFQAISSASLNTSGFSVTAFQSLHTTTGTLTVGTSTWTLNLTSTATCWQFTGAGTLSAASSTIVLGNASTSTRTFAGNGKTYGTLQYTVAASSGALIVTGANAFSTITVTGDSTAKTLTLPSATTTTVTTALNLTGTTSVLSKLNASTATSAATLALAGAAVSVTNVAITDSTATGSTPYIVYADGLPVTPGSLLVSDTTGWGIGVLASETGTASGSSTQVLVLADVETGSGDGQAVVVALRTDSGTAAEGPENVVPGPAELGGGVETDSSTLSLVDAGAGTDASSFATAAAEGGSGAEGPEIVCDLPGDAGSGSEVESEIVFPVESATGLDTSSFSTSDTDAGAGLEAPALLAEVDAADVSGGADLAAQMSMIDANAGAGAQAASWSGSTAESGTGVEALGALSEIVSGDAGEGVAGEAQVFLDALDAGLSLEVAGLLAAATETAAGIDNQLLLTLISAIESGSGLDRAGIRRAAGDVVFEFSLQEVNPRWAFALRGTRWVFELDELGRWQLALVPR